MNRPVYRLEHPQGHGPFYGDQVCAPFLRPHYDPEDLFQVLGFPKEILEPLSTAGLVFGWRTQRLYRQFFKRGGQAACQELGFTCVSYRPALRVDLPDGQVMFLKEPLDPADPLHQALLSLMAVIPQMAAARKAAGSPTPRSS